MGNEKVSKAYASRIETSLRRELHGITEKDNLWDRVVRMLQRTLRRARACGVCNELLTPIISGALQESGLIIRVDPLIEQRHRNGRWIVQNLEMSLEINGSVRSINITTCTFAGAADS